MRRSNEKTIGSIAWKPTPVAFTLILVVFFCVPVGIFLFATGKAYITNNHVLSAYEQEFRKISHPPNTSEVALKRGVYGPPANGSHCFYFVGEVRRFSTNRSSIKAFYAKQQVELLFFGDQKPEKDYLYGLNQLANWNISQTDSNKNLYLVYTLNMSIDENSIDLRCS